MKTPPPPNGQTSADANAETEEMQGSKIDSLRESIRGAERWMIWLTGALAFLALCSVVVGFLQWHSMRGQLAEMKSASADTHQLAESAKAQAEASKAVAESAKTQTESAKMTAESARDAAKIASNTLKRNTESFQLSMRPYLTVTEARFRQPLKSTERTQIECTLRDVGKLPASNAHAVAAVIWHDNSKPFRFPPPTEAMKGGPDIGSVGIPLIFTSASPIPQELITGAIEKRLTLVFYGDVSYADDVFKVPYPPVRFCFWLNPDTHDFAGCRISAYNTVVEIK